MPNPIAAAPNNPPYQIIGCQLLCDPARVATPSLDPSFTAIISAAVYFVVAAWKYAGEPSRSKVAITLLTLSQFAKYVPGSIAQHSRASADAMALACRA